MAIITASGIHVYLSSMIYQLQELKICAASCGCGAFILSRVAVSFCDYITL